VRAEVPGARLLLCGGGVPARVAALHGDGVEVTGHVADLAAALAAATVVALPLRGGGGLRGKLLEAWAAARPVVATAVAVEGFAAADGEHFLLANDAAAFAAALVRCLREPGLAQALGAAGHALVRDRYSAAAGDQAFAAIYERLLEAPA
jgi:glycosyltransferase involved in cell wall biosynthesis